MEGNQKQLIQRSYGRMNFAGIVKDLLINRKHVYVGAPADVIKQIETFYPSIRKQVFTMEEWTIHTSKQGEMNLTYEEGPPKMDNF